MKSKLVKILLGVGFLALVVQIVLIAPSRVTDSGDASAPKNEKPNDLSAGQDIDQSMRGIHMIETQDGNKEWELWSKQATSLKAKELLRLDEPKSIFYADSGTTFTVTGTRGMVRVKTKDMNVEGDVIMRSSNGYTFRTDSLEYNSNERMLATEAPVVVTGPREKGKSGLRLTGFGMRSSVTAGTMEVLNQVVAERELDRGRARIRSRRALFSSQDKVAKFLGEVILDWEEMRITGPEAVFKYNDATDELESILFTGGVRVSDSEKWATSNHLRVDFKSNRFVFWGSPRVVQNNDELRGEEITFIDGGRRVQVKGARAKVNQGQLEKLN